MSSLELTPISCNFLTPISMNRLWLQVSFFAKDLEDILGSCPAQFLGFFITEDCLIELVLMELDSSKIEKGELKEVSSSMFKIKI